MNLRTRVKLFISKFTKGLKAQDADTLITIIEGTESQKLKLWCGADIVCNKRKTNEDPIRAVIKCDQCNTRLNCRGIAASVDGYRMMDCHETKAVITVINEWNKQQRKDNASRYKEVRGSHLRGRHDKNNGGSD